MLTNMLGIDERVMLFRELATLVGSGISLGEALHILRSRSGSIELRRSIADASDRISKGERFSETMKDHPKIFSRLNQAIMVAGEESGRIDEALEEMATYLEHEQELRRTISRETFYPKILVGACIFIPLLTRMLIAAIMTSGAQAFAIGLHALGWYALLAGICAIIWFIYNNYRSTEQGAYNIDRSKLSVPVFGLLITHIAWAKICRAIGALYKAGVSTASALELAAPACGNRAIEKTLLRAIPHVQRGEKLSEALGKSGYIPELPMRMLQTGEETGDIDATMEKVASYFEAQSKTSIHRLSILIIPFAVILVGIVVLIMAMQAYGGYFTGMLNT